MTSLWVLRPKLGIGPIVIGALWHDVSQSLGFFEIETQNEYETFDKEFEEPSGNIRVSTENGLVVSVEARVVCMYNGNNLVGMDIKSFERTIGYEASSVDGPIEYENGDVQTIRNYDDLDIFVVVENELVKQLACF